MAEKDYSIHDVYESIGENEQLRKYIDALKKKRYLGNEKNFLKWWYDSNNKELGKSPDELCKEGRQKELEDFFTETVEQSLDRHQLEISPETSRYLVTMLAKFVDAEKLFPDQNNEAWLEPLTLQSHRIMEETNILQQRNQQQQLGDHCLFLVGYFYDFVRRGGKGQVEYHVQIGSGAYQQTGVYPLVELSQKFSDLYLVIGDLHLPQLNEKKVMEIYGRWEKTEDRYYASLLLGKGIVPQRIKKESN